MEEDNQPRRITLMFEMKIDSSVIQENNLRLPKSFVKKYGHDLSDTVILSAAYGGDHNNAWPVTVEKIGHNACFGKGWREFAQNFSISEGYFLVFEYLWDSKFNVFIYDSNYDKKIYSPSSLTTPQELSNRNQSYPMLLHSSSDEGEEDQEMPNKVHHKTQTLAQILHKSSSASKLDSIDMHNSSDSLEEDTEFDLRLSWSTRTKNYEMGGQRQGSKQQNNEHVPHVRSRSAMSRAQNKNSRDHSRRWRVVTEEDKKRAPQEAIHLKPQNPSCRVAMRPSYITKQSKMLLPAKFGKAHMQRASKVELMVSNDGERWSVLCFETTDSRIVLSNGWLEFVGDNKITEGDTCIFEVINKKNDNRVVVLKVTISRAVEGDQEMPNAIHHKTHALTQILHKSSSASELDSIDTYNSSDSLEEDAEFEPRLSRSTRTKNYEMGGQWQASKQQNSKSNWRNHSRTWRVATEEGKGRASQEAINFEPQNPSCRVAMRSSYITKQSKMLLPAKFGKAHMQGASEVELLISNDGERWGVQCFKTTDSRIVLSNGWLKFVGDNKINEGDTCVFEVINNKDDKHVVVLKVTISRAVEEDQGSAI